MDWTFSEEHQMLRQMVREFVDKEVKPVAGKNDREGKLAPGLLDRARELGLFGVVYPEDVGGAGLGDLGYCLMMEELSHGCNSLAGVIGAHEGLGGMGVHLFANDEQRKRYMPDIAFGRALCCYALSEPNAGSDAQNLQTTAVKKGDRWVLNGQKVWITGADTAGLVVAFAANDKSLRAHGGITAFIVEKGFKGMRIGAIDDKMGLRAMHSPEVFFEECEVPERNVLGKVGEGFRVAMGILDVGRVSLAAACIGTAKESLDRSIEYAQKRETFGKAIVEHQAVQFMLAEMATQIYAMESLVYRTAWLMDQKQKASREAAIAKYYCTEALGGIVDKAIQIHGGMGYMSELPFERFYRDARVNRIFEGTNEIQRIIIAKDLQKRGRY
ncbi:MAG TPA: acyl-CoA dehydrogenase family protein [Planctomycetota bacterium]|nr:acyl-CoA dehydrogenase family protein [Planctomycetota bacterium]